MKTKLPVVAILAFLFSACSTGTYVARTYDDDIYFSPADVLPVAKLDSESPDNTRPAGKDKSEASKQQIIMSQMEENADGSKTINNDIYESDGNNSDYQAYGMDNQQLVESDTTVYYNDDSVKYVINNYYEDDDDMDFAYRINRFHRFYGMSPFFYDDWNYGFNSPWYSGYYGMNYGYGWDSYCSMGWGYPYSYYGGYYSPFAFGFGGYWGGGYGGYYNGYYNGYYSSVGGYYNNHEIARRRSTNMNLPGGGVTANNTRQGRSSSLKNAESGSNLTEDGHVRNRSVDGTRDNQASKSATIIDSRRGSRTNNVNTGNQVRNGETRTQQMVRTGTNSTGNVRRSYEPSTTGKTYNKGQVIRQNQNYTPSYNKPRIVNQSNYNNNSYTRPMTSGAGSPRTTLKSSGSSNSGSNYSQPRSSSSMRQTYRSSSTYSNGSSSSSSRSSSNYSSPSYNNSGSSPSYSSPARSSSSGGSYSGGSSGGSSGGNSRGSSGGGSGHRR